VAIKLGTATPSTFKLGSASVSKIYLGSTQVWPTVSAAAISFANKYGPGSYTLTGTSTYTATITGGGNSSDTRLWLLIGTSGTLSYTVTANSENDADGGRLYLTSSSPASHGDVLAWNVASISGLTNVSGAVAGTYDSTGTRAVTAGQYLVLRYAKDYEDARETDSITATLSIA